MLKDKKKFMIIGDMLELGADKEKEHLKIINLLIKHKIKNVFFVGSIFMSVNNDVYKAFENTNILNCPRHNVCI